MRIRFTIEKSQKNFQKEKNEKLLDLINLSQFIINSLNTGLNAKRWYLLTNKARSGRTAIITP